jgi:hypothetical protein
VYSLVSASVLAIDLARHPSGTAVADVVDRVLALTPADLARLRGPAPSAVRARVLAACADAPRTSRLLDGVVATVAEGLPSRTVVSALSETLMGGLVDLLDLLRRESPLQHADPEAVEVALDAVAAAWAGREADLNDLQQLRAPWAAAVSELPPPLRDTAYGEELRSLLDDIGRRTPEQWQRVAAAHRGGRAGRRWSVAMHDACQAAYRAGRLVEVARAQLAAARALRLSGASTADHAHAIGMAVTAAVQAVCTADLLDEPSLRNAWQAGS